MQLKSRQAITRLQTMKTKVIGFDVTVDAAVEAINDLEKQLSDKDSALVTMNRNFLEVVGKLHDAESEIEKLKSELEMKKDVT